MGLESLVKQFSDVLLRVALSASLAFMPACFHDKDDDEKKDNPPVATTPNNPTPPVVKTGVSGNVFYSGTTIPVSGVTVSIDNVINTTGSAGSFSLQDIVVGSKPLKAEKTGYDPYQQTINVQQVMQPIDIEMTSAQFTFSLTGTIKSSGNNQALQGATITLLNPNNTLSKLSSTSDAQGYYQIPTVPQGQRTVRFQVNNYTTQDIQIFIANTNNKYDLVMNPSGNVVLPSQITKNEVLRAYNSPYILDTDLTIKRGAKLTIEPGVELRIAPQKNIIVEGSLEVLGTLAQPARLTTKNSNPQTSDYWGSLIFNSDTLMQTTNLENLVIEYADKGVTFADLGLNALQMPTITQLKIQDCNTGVIFTGLRDYKVVLSNISIDRTKKGVVVFYDDNSFNNQYEFSNLTINNSTIGISYDGDTKNRLNTGVPKDLSLTLNTSTITTSEVAGTGIIIPHLMLNNCTVQYRNQQQQSDGSGAEVFFCKGTGTNIIKGYKDGIFMNSFTSFIHARTITEISGINIQDCSAGIYSLASPDILNVLIDNCDYGIFDPTISFSNIGKVDSCQITNCRIVGIYSQKTMIKNSIVNNCGELGIMLSETGTNIVNSVISNNHVGAFNYYIGGDNSVLNSRFSSNKYAIELHSDNGVGSNLTCKNSIFHKNGTGVVGGYRQLWERLSDSSQGSRHKISQSNIVSHYSIEEFAGDLHIDYCTFVGTGMHLLNLNVNNPFTQYQEISINDSILISSQSNAPLNNPNTSNQTTLFIDYSYISPSFTGYPTYIGGFTWIPSYPMFVDEANGDLHTLPNSSAKTTSSTGGEIGAYGNNGSPP